MTYDEQAILFDCAGDQLVGVVARPQVAAGTGVVVIVGGPQYRAGSHRQFVLLSRSLAETGYATLRFDYRGMGDSQGELHNFQDVTADVAAAIDALQEAVPSVERVALWGLCDGASSALLYAQATGDARVTHLCLLNPWVRSEASQAKTQVKHYYTDRLRQKEFWQKLLTGKVARSAMTELASSLKSAFFKRPNAGGNEAARSFQDNMAEAWRRHTGPILLVLSGTDYTAKEFLEYIATDSRWVGAMSHARLLRHDYAEADHTFSRASDRKAVETLTLDWLASPVKH